MVTLETELLDRNRDLNRIRKESQTMAVTLTNEDQPAPATGINVVVVGAGKNIHSQFYLPSQLSNTILQVSAVSSPQSNATDKATASQSTSPSPRSKSSATSSPSVPTPAESSTVGKMERSQLR